MQTERERWLHQSLLRLFPHHKVLAQVALSQLIDIPEHHPDRQALRIRYSQLVAHFVLCRADLSVIAVIELDDRAHERADRQIADARKKKALADARIRLIRIPAGQLPSEDALRGLIDADGMGEKIYPEEAVMTLAEGIYAPPSPYDSDQSHPISRQIKRLTPKALTLAAVVACGWLFYNSFLPTVMQQFFAPSVNPVHAAAGLAKARVASQSIASDPVAAPPVTDVSSEARRAREQEIIALGEQKNRAFAAFYSPSASCEQPIEWSAQAECRNQYILARRAFESKWAAEHPSQGGVAEVVSDNRSAAGPLK